MLTIYFFFNFKYLFFSVLQISKATISSWKMTLLNVCSFVNNLNSQAEETGEFREEELITRRKFPTALDGFSLEAMLTIYQLQKICHSRAFQQWEVTQKQNTNITIILLVSFPLYWFFFTLIIIITGRLTNIKEKQIMCWG